jgi:hypothetical protein
MNTLLKATAQEIETDYRRHDNTKGDRNAKASLRNQGIVVPLWLKARARTIGLGREDLERSHWKKVWRSMDED